jgi:hypothetical protein
MLFSKEKNQKPFTLSPASTYPAMARICPLAQN